MAENTIDNLSIQVTASAENAARVFDRLASSAGRLRGAAQGAAGGMQDMAQGARDAGTATATAGTQAGRAEPRIRSTGKAAKDAGDNAKKGASGLANFWQSLKRIAFYRFVRTVLKEITSAFKEGITNLYKWSSAVNGTFSKSMDRIATSTLYLKNSLGAMLAPLINTLAPVIEWIIDRIVEVINWINKLFAALSGSQTYVVAKKVATTWGDAGKDAAGSAKKAADNIKRTILGFDEINKLEKQNTSSGSSGSGSSSGPNYKDMFEERKLDGWMSKLASFIDKFNLQIPAVFGGLLAGWAAVKLAIEGVAKLSLGWLKDMAGKVIEIGVSLFRKGWTTIKNWALSFGEAVVDMAVRIKTSVVELWEKLAAAWAALSPVLKVGIAISVTAAALWAAYKLAWALVPDKMLQVEVAIKTAAVTLKNGLVKAWNNLAVWSLNVGVKIATTAISLKNELVKAWNGLAIWSLNVGVKIATTANALKDGLVKAWNNLAIWSLGVGVKIATAANSLKDGLVKAWNDLAVWTLGVGVRIATTAAALKNDIISAWNKLTEWFLGVKLRIETKLSDLWQWVKDNWKVVAAAALGIAIAIATPWSTIAAALSALWADVMASFGGALAFSVVPTLNPTGNYGLGWTPEEFNSKQEEIDNAARELRGSSKTDTSNNSGALKGLLGVGAVGAVAALVSGLFSGGASTALASVFMPGVNGAADKSQLSPNTPYYNNMTGEFVVPKSVDVGVNFTSSANPTYKNKTLGNYIVDTMKNVKATAQTKVSSIAGTAMRALGNALQPIIGNTDSTNTVKALAGSAMRLAGTGLAALVGDTTAKNIVNGWAGIAMKAISGGLSAIVGDTSSKNTVNGAAGSGIMALGNAFSVIVGDTNTTNTVNGAVGTGMVYTWEGYMPKTKDTTTTNTVKGAPGAGMKYTWDGFMPVTTDTTSTVNVSAKTPWGTSGVGSVLRNVENSVLGALGLSNLSTDVDVGLNSTWGWQGALSSLGLSNLDTDVDVGLRKNWWGNATSALGLDNLNTTISVGMKLTKNTISLQGGGGGMWRLVTQALGGIFSGGKWSDIPQYAGGTTNAHGSLFLAGEAGPEIVGHVGGRTEVLNKSQLAAAMYQAVNSAMQGVTLDANFYGGSESTEDNYATMYQAMYDAFSAVMAGSADRDREKVQLLRSINDKDFNVDVSTASINKAQSRMNRRAGVTIAPVGT